MPNHKRRRPLWRRVLSHPLVAAELAFVIVVVATTLVAISPVGEHIGLMIATHEDRALVAALVVALWLLAVCLFIGVGMVTLQRLGRPRRDNL